MISSSCSGAGFALLLRVFLKVEKVQDSLGSKQEAWIVLAWQRAVLLPIISSRTVFQYFNTATVTLAHQITCLKGQEYL